MAAVRRASTHLAVDIATPDVSFATDGGDAHAVLRSGTLYVRRGEALVIVGESGDRQDCRIARTILGSWSRPPDRSGWICSTASTSSSGGGAARGARHEGRDVFQER